MSGLSGRRRLVKPVAELLRTHAQMLLDVFAEERQGGKIQLDGDFLNALVGILQEADYVLKHGLMDKRRSGVGALLLADGRKILGRDVQTAGIVGHAARTGVYVG